MGADRVTVSYPADLSGWGRHQVERPAFEAYLRKTLGSVAVGDVVDTFVGVGCCGDTLDVPLRIEAVDGAGRVDGETEVAFTVRDACDLRGGWRVQSAAGPTE